MNLIFTNTMASGQTYSYVPGRVRKSDLILLLCNASAKDIRKPHGHLKKGQRGYREDSGITYSVQLYNSG